MATSSLSAEQAEELKKLRERTEAVKSAFSEVATLELRRRINVASAIIKTSEPLFARSAALKQEIEERTASPAKPLLWSGGVGLFGYGLHYVFRDPSKSIDFTVGSAVMGFAVLMYCVHAWETFKRQQEFREQRRRVEEMLYQWLANGGSADSYRALEAQTDAITGVHYNSDEYALWWYDMEMTLLERMADNVLLREGY